MRRVVIALVLVAVILLTGCAEMIRNGEVYEKEFQPAHTSVRTYPLVRFDAASKTTTTTVVPYVVRYPDRWIVRIKQYDGTEWRYGAYYVTEQTYHAVDVGDMFEVNTDRGDTDKEPYTRTRKES